MAGFFWWAGVLRTAVWTVPRAGALQCHVLRIQSTRLLTVGRFLSECECCAHSVDLDLPWSIRVSW